MRQKEYIYQRELNPLGPKSDQHQFSLVQFSLP